MARVKSPRRQKHKKVLKQAKGFKNARSRRLKVAKEAVLHAGQYAFVGRKKKKRDFRKLWIMRINAAARKHSLSYSKLMNALKKAEVKLDRKMLSEIAVNDPETFDKIVSDVK